MLSSKVATKHEATGQRLCSNETWEYYLYETIRTSSIYVTAAEALIEFSEKVIISFQCVLLGDQKVAEQLKKEFKVPDKRLVA